MSNHIDIYWILLLTFFITRTVIARFSKFRDQYFKQIPIEEKEAQVYVNQRNHLIILASFTIVAIAVIIGIPKAEVDQRQAAILLDSLFYLSIGMTASFIGSYLFTIVVTRWPPFFGETLEYTAILAIGFGLYKLIEFVTIDPRIIIIYIAFVGGILVLAIYDLIFNKRFFHPKPEEEEEEDNE